MNTVITKPVPPITNKITVGSLIGSNMRNHGHTAFIGKLGSYQGLFLITYEAIVLVSTPNTTWNYDSNHRGIVHVDHYCNVTITENEK